MGSATLKLAVFFLASQANATGEIVEAPEVLSTEVISLWLERSIWGFIGLNAVALFLFLWALWAPQIKSALQPLILWLRPRKKAESGVSTQAEVAPSLAEPVAEAAPSESPPEQAPSAELPPPPQDQSSEAPAVLEPPPSFEEPTQSLELPPEAPAPMAAQAEPEAVALGIEDQAPPSEVPVESPAFEPPPPSQPDVTEVSTKEEPAGISEPTEVLEAEVPGPSLPAPQSPERGFEAQIESVLNETPQEATEELPIFDTSSLDAWLSDTEIMDVGETSKKDRPR